MLLLIFILLLLLSCLVHTAPVARHMSVVVNKNADVVINLLGYSATGNKLTATITSLPSSGSLYQLSQVFNDYGYLPARGVALSSNNVVVTGSSLRIIYSPPPNTNAPAAGSWSQFTYTINDGTSNSNTGIVTLVSSNNVIVGSKFDNGAEGWTIDNNGLNGAGVFYEQTSRGALNHYIWSKDTDINVDTASGTDKDQWYFRAPSKFLGNQVISYGGSISFWISSTSGDFSSSNRNLNDDFVELVCNSCAIQTGIRLVRRISQGTVFNGGQTQITIPLNELMWLKDSKNTLIPFQPPSQCEMVEVLQGLSSIRILGDFTKWYESVSIDSVMITAGPSSSTSTTIGIPLPCYPLIS